MSHTLFPVNVFFLLADTLRMLISKEITIKAELTSLLLLLFSIFWAYFLIHTLSAFSETFL